MKIILIGYMGSGKTVVGKGLSKELDLPFYDLDQEIVRRQGLDIPSIFKEKGEIGFRKIELQVLGELLQSEESYVLSLGGGTPCYGNSMEMIKQTKDAHTIYLKASLETLLGRLWGEREFRPLIAHLDSQELLEDFLRKHLFERQFYYNQSDLVVEVNEKNVEGVVAQAKNLLNEHRAITRF